MKIIILGADGYLGWPTAMHLAQQGHEITALDNYLKRGVAKKYKCESLTKPPSLDQRVRMFYDITDKKINVDCVDCKNYLGMCEILDSVKPDAIVHYAEIPSAPYSMIGYAEANLTMINNLSTTLSLAHAVMEVCPETQIVKLGTMGEYGTPTVPIKEGWLNYELDGCRQKFLYPSCPGSLYHTTKVQDTHLLWLYSRMYDLKVTDIMQGPVYGISTKETDLHEDLCTTFHYDDLFGTVINRFVVQALAGIPLTVYGKGGQTRGFINIRDVVRCIELICNNPPEEENFRILNQITSINTIGELSELVVSAANELDLDTKIGPIDNPRKEDESHLFEVEAEGLKRLGLKDTVKLDKWEIVNLISSVQRYKDEIDIKKIMPRVSWK